MNDQQRQFIGKRVAYTIVSSAITVLLGVLIAVTWRFFFNDPPITIETLDIPPVYALCPGVDYPAHNEVTVSRPVMLYSYFSVMDARGNHNINGTQVTNGPRLHPHPATFIQMLPWEVPELPPGDYMRVLAFRGTDGRENSLFLTMPFSIGKNCKPTIPEKDKER